MERIYIYSDEGLIEAIEGKTEEDAYNNAAQKYDMSAVEWTYDLADVPERKH